MSAAVGLEMQQVTAIGGDATTLERLGRAAELRPDLARLVPFWAHIYRVQFAARGALVAAHGTLSWPLRDERLLAGRPQLEPADLPLDPEAIAGCVCDLAAAWRAQGAACALPLGEDWARRVRRVFLDATLAPGQRYRLGFADTLAFLALVPYLEWAASSIAPALQGEPEAWSRGSCPVCGGRPDLAVLAGDPASRSLVCSRCSTVWAYPRVGCPFCHDVEGQVYHAGDDGTHRLYLCPQCWRYLKTVDLRADACQIDPWAERLLTIDMDLAALEAGYGPER